MKITNIVLMCILSFLCLNASNECIGQEKQSETNKTKPIQKIHDVVGLKWSWKHNKNQRKKHWIMLQKNGVALTNWNQTKITWKVIGLRDIEINTIHKKKKKRTILKWSDDFSHFSAQGLNIPDNYVRGQLMKK